MSAFSVIIFLTFSFAFGFSGITANAVINKARGSAFGKPFKTGIVLEDLPYDYKALEPYISERTLKIHHDKHHAKYVSTATDMIKGTPLENENVISIVRQSYNRNQALFNNAGQAFNHEFYWNSMKVKGGGEPTGAVAALIKKDFGTYDKFRTEFENAAMTAFGSGWAWLTLTPTGLKVTCVFFQCDQVTFLITGVSHHRRQQSAH
jgi:superoxide dismutase